MVLKDSATIWLTVALLLSALSCGTGTHNAPVGGALSGNWQITLVRHNSTDQWALSGFLSQTGNNITGSFVLNVGCQGVGSVTGTFDGQNLQLTVGSSGQDFNLSATVPQGADSTSLSGQFSTLQGGCISFSSSGTWTAIRVPAISGSFHGTFVETSGQGTTVDVTGTLTQGPNIGASSATLTGAINATGTTSFCSYLNNATVTGLISGTSFSLNFYGPDGTQIGQIPAPGSTTPALVAPDGSSLTGSFAFGAISSTCSGFTGGQPGATLTFP